MSDRTGPKKQSTPEALLEWLDDGAATLKDSHYDQVAALIRELQARIAELEAALHYIGYEPATIEERIKKARSIVEAESA